jgi:ATP-dependent DNA helicase RecQ
VHDALLRLAAVLADPGAAGARAALDAVRAGWKALPADEREALTPVAKLAAARVAAAEAAARPSLFDLPAEDAAPVAAVAPVTAGASEPAPSGGTARATVAAASTGPATADAPSTPAPDDGTTSPGEEAEYLDYLASLEGDAR